MTALPVRTQQPIMMWSQARPHSLSESAEGLLGTPTDDLEGDLIESSSVIDRITLQYIKVKSMKGRQWAFAIPQLVYPPPQIRAESAAVATYR